MIFTIYKNVETKALIPHNKDMSTQRFDTHRYHLPKETEKLSTYKSSTQITTENCMQDLLEET